ncbi:MAG: NAD(P)-dependent alcohol dehydrogenase [Devosiaceae bacterium]|nr:NAD(P)-dependent alcohol dehydrogenase [Devosiaceae bacterium]
MKAAIYKKYGSPEVVHIVELEKPVPKDNEVLIKVYATTVSAADWRARSLEMPKGFSMLGRLVFGIFAPRQPILGTELAGTIEAVGKGVNKYKVGDKVFADCGLGSGAHAEYKAMPQDGAIALKPDNLSFEQAAALCFGGTVALDFLKKLGKIKQGEKVLINGASGTTGTALVQFAKYFGAHVTGVCSGANLELVKSIGADKVIDYTNEDFTKNSETYDIIADTAGNAPWSRSKNSLNKTGRLLLVLGSLKDMLLANFVSKKNGKKLIAGVANGSAKSLKFIADLAEQGKFIPVIDRIYPLEQIVEAHRHVDTGRKKGSVVITLEPNNSATNNKKE